MIAEQRENIIPDELHRDIQQYLRQDFSTADTVDSIGDDNSTNLVLSRVNNWCSLHNYELPNDVKEQLVNSELSKFKDNYANKSSGEDNRGKSRLGYFNK